MTETLEDRQLQFAIIAIEAAAKKWAYHPLTFAKD